MNLLFVLPHQYGSLGTNASYMFTQELALVGHNVNVLALESGETPVAQVGARVRLLQYPPNSMWARIRFVSKAIDEISPDVVHVMFRRYAFMFPLLHRLMHIGHSMPKWVLDIRSPLLTSGTKRFAAKLIGVFEQLGYDAVATHCLASAGDNIPLLMKKIYLLPAGVTIEKIARSSRDDLQKGLVRAVYVGSLSEKRQLAVLLRALHKAQTILGKRVALSVDIYGDGGARSGLESLASELAIQNVTFKGLRPHDEVMNVLCQYDIGLAYIPGGAYENAPGLKTLEYMAAGLCVVASDTAGNRIFINGGRNGYLAKNDPDTMSRILVSAIDSLPNRSMRTYAIEDVQRWDWRQITTRQLIPMYEELLCQ